MGHPNDTIDPDDVLFVCVENSARSQMAEGFLKAMAPNIRVQSAGTAPGGRMNPIAVEAMREIGIDMAGQEPKSLTGKMLDSASIVVNMGCIDKESCPALFVDDMQDWQIDDPRGKDIRQVRAIRDEIRQKVSRLADELEHKRTKSQEEIPGETNR